MESAFDALGHEPLETGKQLHRLEQQKTRSEHAFKVLEHLNTFKHSNTDPTLKTAIDKGGEEAEEAVKIVKSLMEVSAAASADAKGDQMLSNIRHFAESIIADLQADFKEALSVRDRERMAVKYGLLSLVEKEEECRTLHVHCHPLLSGDVVNGDSLYSSTTAVALVGREEPEEPLIRTALERLWKVCGPENTDDEEDEISLIFNHDADLVRAELIEEYVDKRLRPLIAECLQQAKQHSPLARQRQLYSIYHQFTVFCAQFNDTNQNTIADAIDSLLQPYLTTIVNDEKQCNEELLRVLMVKAGKLKRSTVNGASIMFTDGKPLVPTMIAVSSPQMPSSPVLNSTPDTLDLPTSDTVQRALVLTAEAAGRVMSVVGMSTAEHILPSLLSQLLTIVFQLDPLDQILSISDPPKYGFDPLHLMAVQSAHTALTALQLWFERHYGMLAAGVSAGCYAECVRVKSETMSGIELKMKRIINKVLDWSILFIREYYWKQHKKQDYAPTTNTEPAQVSLYCQQLCLFVKRFATAMRERVEEAIADPWLFHFSIRLLHSFLHDLLKRATVSQVGSIVLLQDCQHLAAIIPSETNPHNTNLHSLYAVCLKEVSRLFMVRRVEAVRAAVQEGGLASVDLKLVLPFVAGRADCRSNPRLMMKYFPDYHNAF